MPVFTMRVLHSVFAILAGYLTFALSAVALFQLSGRDPHAPQPLWFVVVAVVYGMAFAGLGGCVATRIAPVRSQRHAGILAVVVALGATVSLIASPGAGATWSQWSAITLMAPSAYLGGVLTRRLVRAL
jgi:FtsH-binding integral membrane protein